MSVEVYVLQGEVGVDGVDTDLDTAVLAAGWWFRLVRVQKVAMRRRGGRSSSDECLAVRPVRAELCATRLPGGASSRAVRVDSGD